jgi:post-segregation antitoxin (ccd killing protein)
MTKISVYMNDDLYTKLKARSLETGESMSKINKKALQEYFKENWPEEFFELIGSCKDCPIEEPEEIPWELDAPRPSFDN